MSDEGVERLADRRGDLGETAACEGENRGAPFAV
jgi:hypothetical protein